VLACRVLETDEFASRAAKGVRRASCVSP